MNSKNVGSFRDSQLRHIKTFQWKSLENYLAKMNGTAPFRNVNNCLNTKIYSYLETSGGQSYNLYLNVVHFFNASLNQTSVTAEDSCFPEIVSYALFYPQNVENLMNS